MHSEESGDPAVLHLVWNLIRGGTEGQCARVAMELARGGARQRVAVFRREGFFLEDVTATCGPVYHLDIRGIKKPRTLLEIIRLSRFIRRERFAVVHCWDADAAVFGSMAARLAGVPCITSRRDLGAIYANWKLRLMARADRRAVAVVANAEAIKDQLVGQGCPSEKIVCIPNILDVTEFDRLAEEPFPALPTGRWGGVVARLDPEKDVDVIIHAAALLKESHPDIRFAIAGDGRERAHLESLASKCGVSNAVCFLGDITAVPAFLSKCVIGVLTPKANEGLSNTILEYMAAGLPVVATDCGGNRELVIDGVTGSLVPVGDARSIAAAIADLWDHTERAEAFGHRARSVVEQNHRPEPVAKQFADVYARVGAPR